MRPNTILLAMLTLVGCSSQAPDEIVTPGDRSDQRVRAWLASNSYLMVVNHIRPGRPVVDWNRWVAQGKEIPNIELVLRGLLANRDSDIELPLVAQTLGVLGNTDTVPVLVDAFSSDELHLRLQAAAALGALKDPSASGPLGKLLRVEPDENVRANIVVALENIGGSHALRCLEIATRDKSPFVSQLAHEALSGIK